MARKRVSVDYAREGITPGESVAILFRCHTVKEAEDWIAKREDVDREGVHAGRYGINAPEEFV